MNQCLNRYALKHWGHGFAPKFGAWCSLSFLHSETMDSKLAPPWNRDAESPLENGCLCSMLKAQNTRFQRRMAELWEDADLKLV